jgi:hypothetical protein
MSASISIPVTKTWLGCLLRGHPHQIIGPTDEPYMWRWFLLPHNRFANFYLHAFAASDDPDALHNHPWAFVSLMLRGSYIEHTEHGARTRRAGSLVVRPARFYHRIEIPEAPSVRCWTLVITGPKVQHWGFRCRSGRLVPWTQFGGGCGEDQ